MYVKAVGFALRARGSARLAQHGFACNGKTRMLIALGTEAAMKGYGPSPSHAEAALWHSDVVSAPPDLAPLPGRQRCAAGRACGAPLRPAQGKGCAGRVWCYTGSYSTSVLSQLPASWRRVSCSRRSMVRDQRSLVPTQSAR